MMARLRKGDTVAVLWGKDRGKRGKILKVLTAQNAAVVERVNLLKHFERRTSAEQPGGIIEREAPVSLEKLTLVCGRCNRPTRIGWTTAGNEKQRLCKRCGEVFRG